MKKVIVLLACTLVLGGCLKKEALGAIKISTNQPASVQIDGKNVGQTPYSDEKIRAGEMSIRLTPQDTSLQPWDSLIDVESGVLTVVNRNFATNNNQAEGHIMTMKPISQAVASISVVSEPDGAMVKLDGSPIGPTPLEKNQVNEGSHKLVISAPGYKELEVSINTQSGYKVMIDAKLSKLEVAPITDISEATDSADATDSATTTTPAPSGAVSPTSTKSNTTPTPTKAGDAKSTGKVKILSTPTGWLRVRKEASVNSEEVGKVNPGETYDLLDEDSGWYKIKLEDGDIGWVAGQYADKV